VDFFKLEDLAEIYSPEINSSGEDNGQITIIGGSSLFHGAPILSLKASTRVVDMVFFTSPENYLANVSEYIKSQIASFIWVDYSQVANYIEKSDAVLIGPGFMRYHTEDGESGIVEDEMFKRTREMTTELLKKFPDKKWVIDAGSLQTLDLSSVPAGSILTPNKKEFEMLSGFAPDDDLEKRSEQVSLFASKISSVVVLKDATTIVSDGKRTIGINGGNPGLTKGGTGDTQAGLTVALLAKNTPFLSASAASYIVKKSAEELAEEVGVYFSSDDLADQVHKTLFERVSAAKGL
jgi:NAD(P)H-hydrate epimerase